MSESYILQEDTIMIEYDPPHTAFVGDSSCNAVFWNWFPKVVYWYIPMNKYGIAMFRLKEVVLIDTKMMSLNKTNNCSHNCNT